MPHNHIHAQVILAQLGGKHFVAMTGAQCFAATEFAVHFKMPPHAPDGINYIVVILMMDNTYNMEGWHCDDEKTRPVFIAKGLRVEDLQATLQAHTGSPSP